MQSNIFAKVDPLLKEKKFNIDCNELIAFLNHYHKGDWIYPEAVYRNLKVNIKIVYEILEMCVDLGMLKQYLRIYCPRCKRFTGTPYKTIYDVPEEVYCVHCDYEIVQPLKYAVIIYRVL